MLWTWKVQLLVKLVTMIMWEWEWTEVGELPRSVGDQLSFIDSKQMSDPLPAC